MNRSLQEVVELVVFALVAVIIGTGAVWLSGWILGLVGTVLTWLAGLVWALLRFLVPVALVAGAVYLLVRYLNDRNGADASAEGAGAPPSPWTMSAEGPGASPADEGTDDGTDDRGDDRPDTLLYREDGAASDDGERDEPEASDDDVRR